MSRAARALSGLWILLAACLGATVAGAHPLAPSLLEIREQRDGAAAVIWKEPATRLTPGEIRPVLPAGCRPVSAVTLQGDETARVERWTARCGKGGIAGQRVGVEGLRGSGVDALVRVRLADGRLVQRVLRADGPSFVVPVRPRSAEILREYAALGMRHILGGPDHLLFVFGLLLLVARPRALALTITAFTAGHSLTLALAVLGLIRFPTGPIELAIALTVFALAVEVARGPAAASGWMRRFPWGMAFLFGLLHGLGFAGALAQVGLPAGEIPLALLSFNLGIEAGQLLVVPAVLLARALFRMPGLVPSGRIAWSARAPVYLMGSLAAFWCLQRAAALFS